MTLDFHEIQFPPNISRGTRGGPERKTQIVVGANGRETRNQQWAQSRRKYNAAKGVRGINDLYAVLEFFEERRGRLTGFRWKDWSDFKSCPPDDALTAQDQVLGIGDGAQTTFQLVKTYGGSFNPYERQIKKPVAGTIAVAVDGNELQGGFQIDTATGLLSFMEPPGLGSTISAGFEFDVPVRFDADYIEVDLEAARLGSVPAIAVVEVLL